ncbi:MAG: sigma-70 family RNA polymerase sigma factor [Pirellulales bacterium]
MLIASQLLAPTSSVGNRLQEQEYEQLVLDAAGQLDELDREILLMRIVEGLTHFEISHVLDMTDTAVRKRFGRALIKLKDELTRGGLTGA